MDFENMICLSYLGCSSSFKFEFIIHEHCDIHSVSLYMPQGRAHRNIHLIDLQGHVSTGQTQMKNRDQLTCNNIKVTTLSTRSNPSFKTRVNTGALKNVQVWKNGLDN